MSWGSEEILVMANQSVEDDNRIVFMVVIVGFMIICISSLSTTIRCCGAIHRASAYAK